MEHTMRIGFDAKRLYHNFTGLGNYSRSLVRNLLAFDETKRLDLHLYTPKTGSHHKTEYFVNHQRLHTHTAPPKAIKSLWRSYSIKKQIHKDNIDLFHGLSHELPFSLKNSKVKTVVTVHDLIYKRYPKTFPLVDRTLYDLKYKASCMAANSVIAISESTKSDLMHYYKIPEEKIKVIYQSCQPLFYEGISEEECKQMLKAYPVPTDYILSVGSVEKRKNLKLVVEAYSQLPASSRPPLVIVGRGKTYQEEVKQLAAEKGLDKELIWLNQLTQTEHLYALYSKALAVVYPSFYEGFGLPVAEALLCKTPVITSNQSSLPEAGGPGALYVDPKSAEAMAEAIKRLTADSSLRDALANKGYEYAMNKFSPKPITQQLIQHYEKMLA